MKTIPSIFLFGIACIASGEENSAATECPGPDTSSRFEGCVLSKETAEVDAKLNMVYGQLLKRFEGMEKRALVKEERKWIRDRDKTCNSEQEEGGGINSIGWVRCMNRLTKERLRYLEEKL